MKKLSVWLLLAAGSVPLFAQPLKESQWERQLREQDARNEAQEKADEVLETLLSDFETSYYDKVSRSSSSARAVVSSRDFVAGASATFPFTPVGPTILPYFNRSAASPLRYNPFAAGPAPAGVAPGAFQIAFLDGTGSSLVVIDLGSLSVVGQLAVPGTSGPFGIRPNPAGPAKEAWVANGGLQVSVATIGSQSPVANIPTPSVPQSSTPAGIVFTPDGATAFEAFAYPSPDASGNRGALLVFDAVNRKVAATVPLKYGPTAVLIAPDGLTVYLLSGSGELTYYDVLSGTADLSVSTYTPGSNGGYPGASAAVFMHPSGSRLLWNVNYMLEEFDLTTRTVVGFNSGLPSTSAAAMTLSQDGGRAYFSNGAGDVAVVDTESGLILATYNAGGPALLFGGPPAGQ